MINDIEARRPTSLAPTQEGQWELMSALSPADPGSSRVLIVDNRYLDGTVDYLALNDAFRAVIRRHDALRLAFDSIGPDPVVTIKSDITPPVEFLDLSKLTECGQRTKIEELSFRENRRCFDLREGPLWHAWLVRLDQTRHLLNVSFSHIIADGSSCEVFMRDLLAAYAAKLGRAPWWTLDAASFGELHALQTRRFEMRTGAVRYWQERLVPIPQNPVFVRRAAAEADLLARARISFMLTPATAAELRRVAWRARTTPFVALLAGYHLLLAMVTGKERTVIASGTLSRPTEREKNAIMQFVSDPYVCTDLPASSSLQQVVRGAHLAMTQGIENLISFTAIARAVNPDFDSSRPWPDYHLCDGHFFSSALFDSGENLSGLQVRYADMPGGPPATYSPELVAGQLSDRLYPAWEAWCGPSVAIGMPRDGGLLRYNDKIYPVELMQAFVDQYVWILDTLAASPELTVGALRERHARRFAAA